MKSFDIADALKYDCSVSKTRIKLCDKRSGEMFEHVVYHPGDSYPLNRMGRVIEGFGYGVLSCDTEDTVTGIVPWDEIFSYLERKEKGALS